MQTAFHNPTPPRFSTGLVQRFRSIERPRALTYWTQLHFSMDIAIEGLHICYVVN
jgi:hypothetical protein